MKIPVIRTLVRAIKYSHSDYEHLALALYRDIYGVKSPTPEMLHTFACQLRRQDRAAFVLFIIAAGIIVLSIWNYWF